MEAWAIGTFATERAARSATAASARCSSASPTRRARSTTTRRAASGPTTGKWATDFKVEQSDYVDQDLRFAFGAIDRLDIEVDFDAKTITGWFQDRYEWHPVYAGLYKKWPDDDARETNCVHAALVEPQSGTAAEYWMQGEATVPLSVLSAGAVKRKSSGWF
jgi:hypothetical protein